MALSRLLSTYVVDELGGGLDTDLRLHLFNKGVSIYLASVESFEGVVQAASCSIVELYEKRLKGGYAGYYFGGLAGGNLAAQGFFRV